MPSHPDCGVVPLSPSSRGEGWGEGSVCSFGLVVTTHAEISMEVPHEKTASSPLPSPPEEERGMPKLDGF